MNSNIQNMIRSLATVGKFEDTVTIGDVTFEIGILDTEELLLADALVDLDELHEELAGDQKKQLNVYNYSFDTLKMVTRLAMLIRSMNGESPVLTRGTKEERIESIKAFRKDLLMLDGVILDKLNEAYNALLKTRQDFFGDAGEHAKK